MKTIPSPYALALMTASAVMLIAVPGARAELIAGDSFVTGTGGYTAGGNLFEFGIRGATFELNTAGGAAIENYRTTYAPLVGATDALTNLFILRLEINAAGDDLFTLYLNPTDVTSEATAAATAGFTVQLSNLDIANSGAEIAYSGFRTQSNGTANPNIFADEIRIGTTFNDVVTAVPEPASATLLLAGAGLITGLRRRR